MNQTDRDIHPEADTQEHTGDDGELAGLPLLLPIPRAANLLGISRSLAYRCAKTGALPTTSFGGRTYINTAKLRELLDAS